MKRFGSLIAHAIHVNANQDNFRIACLKEVKGLPSCIHIHAYCTCMHVYMCTYHIILPRVLICTQVFLPQTGAREGPWARLCTSATGYGFVATVPEVTCYAAVIILMQFRHHWPRTQAPPHVEKQGESLEDLIMCPWRTVRGFVHGFDNWIIAHALWDLKYCPAL